MALAETQRLSCDRCRAAQISRMTKRWTYYAMAGAAFVIGMSALSPEMRELGLAARMRITVFGVAFFALGTYLLDRYLHPRMYRLFERIQEYRERKESEREPR